MATQYTSILKLALPTQGELSGTWGDVVNDNITSMVEEAIAGRSVINSWAANSHTLTTADGLTSESRAAMLEFTDTGTALSGAATVICPTATKIYVCKNGAGQTVTVKTAAGTGVAIPNGETMFVFCDGTNVVQAVTSLTTLKVGTGIQVSTILDEDNMASDSATALATQQSIKAYVDAQITAQDLDFAGDTGTGAVDLDSQTFTVAGTANEIETSASGQTITIGLPTAIVVTTITTTNVQATNIKANDGTAAITIADSTGQVTVTDAVLTTADINGGTADNVTIGGSTAAAGSFTTLGASGTTTLSGALALTGNLDINTNKFNVTAVNGNTLIAGTLGVTGNVDLNGGTIDGTVIGGSTAAAITGTTITGTSFVSSGDMTFGDDDKAIFGAGSDLQIYHDGTNSYISDQGTNDLKVLATDFQLKNSADNEFMMTAVTDGAVTLYHNNAAKLATTSTGIDVTGTAVTDGLTVAGNVSVDGGTIKLDGNYPVGTANVALGDAALNGSITGNYNTALGNFIMQPLTSGASNTGVGNSALRFVTSGSSNTAVGDSSLFSNTTADNNTAVGYQALTANTIAANNTAVGYAALTANTTGTQNVAVGSQSLLAHTTGNYNVAVGQNALVSNTTASDNTGVGAFSLDANTTGANNTAVGKEALGSNTTADSNTAVGYQAGYSNTTGTANHFIGKSAGFSNLSGGDLIYIGLNTGYYATGERNTFVGGESGVGVSGSSTGTNNTAIGYRSYESFTTGIHNVAVGELALKTTSSGSYNVGIGNDALRLNTTASNNTAVGYQAAYSNTTGNNSVFVGYQAGYNNTTGAQNVAIGDRPMFSGAVSGSFNNAVGAFALRYLTSGSNNVAIGNEALQANTTASNNTAVGYQSLYANTTGAFNTAMGGLALNQATTAAANTCIGYGSGQSLSTGGDNVFVGYLAGQYGISASTGVNNVIVGAYSRLSAVDGNEQIVLGRNIVSGGNSTFRVGAGANTATIAINGSATAFTAASDVRLKENILDSSVGLNFINDLRPVTYTWKAKQDVPTDMSQYEENSSEPCRGFGQTNYGFVAQEVKAVIEKHNLVAGQNIHRVDPDGTNELAPGELVPMLVKAIQELTTQLDAALARITTLEGA
jgi:trimeric autotransporter adhesin